MAADRDAAHKSDLAGLVQILEEARREWDVARNLFSEVAEPDLVDIAIFRLEAAERRYMYYWKKTCQAWGLTSSEGGLTI